MIMRESRCYFREGLAEEVIFNQCFECRKRVSCVPIFGEKVGEGNARAKALRQKLSWYHFRRQFRGGELASSDLGVKY